MNTKLIHKTHTLQHDFTDCGVACLLSIIKLNGGFNTLEKLREISGTNTQGTTLLGLYQAANQLGFEANGCEANIDALIEHNAPVILHIQIKEEFEHYLVCYGFIKERNVFLIGDPAKGIEEITKEDLDKIWVSKSCLTLKIKSEFVKEKKYNTSKKNWFLKLIAPDNKLLVISVFIGVFIAGLGMAMSMFSQKLIDEILPSNNIKKLIGGLVLLTILLLARVFLGVIREYILMQQSKNFNERINSYFFSSLMQLPKPFYDTRKIQICYLRIR